MTSNMTTEAKKLPVAWVVSSCQSYSRREKYVRVSIHDNRRQETPCSLGGFQLSVILKEGKVCQGEYT